jgi:predicted RNase H-like HicB family nuclease
MARYPALIDGEKGAYGVTFPDLPGIVAMGASVDEVLVNAEEALRDYVIEAEGAGDAITPPTPMEQVITPAGHTLVSVPFIRVSGRRVRASLTLDEGVAAFIDGEARRRNMTRTAFVEWMARRIAQEGG